MIKNYYVYKNNKIGCFYDPFYLPYPREDVPEAIRQAVMSNPPSHADELSLYFLGSMDDKTADFKQSLDFILDLSEFLNYGAKEGK